MNNEKSTMEGVRGCSEYDSVLSGQLSESILKGFCIGGGLRTSNLRSIIWRIYLKCLPLSKSEWILATNRSRGHYHELKKRHIRNPHEEGIDMDPQENNPLSDVETSPWTKFFADYDLRDIIAKDVNRTFPELQYFQQEDVRSIMMDILLTYCKENSVISYKQGMHEILAILMFVVYSDLQSFQHAQEKGELGHLSTEDHFVLQTVYDEQFLEHDAFTMFCGIMVDINRWFEDGIKERTETPVDPIPFMRVKDGVTKGGVLEELASYDARLHSVDPRLASHLTSLDVPPQLYAIRWLRLLYAREFNITDLLYLWDVMIADRPIPRVSECVFIAMLETIRDNLLSRTDNSGVLNYLMKYPPVVDISAFVQLVLHYRNPTRVPKPALPGVNNFANITVAGTSHPNEVAKTESFAYEEPPSAFRPKSRSMLSKVTSSIVDNSGISAILPSSPRKSLTKASPSPQKTPKKTPQKKKSVSDFEKEFVTLHTQMVTLQTNIIHRDMLCADVAQELEQVAQELGNASSDGARKLISDRLRQLKTRLGAKEKKDAGPIERADEMQQPPPRPPVRIPRMEQNNEMIELNTNRN